MLKLLISRFTKNISNDDEKRIVISSVCNIYGIVINILLFIVKYIAGVLSGLVSITSDSFNNLSDAGTLVVSMIGIKLSNKKQDSDHPFGHGRIEYLAGLFVSVLIILMGFELLKDSFMKTIHPEPIESSYFLLTIIILAVSVIVKLYMFFYYRKYAKVIDSVTMSASSKDSISDVISTLSVLVASLIVKSTGFTRLDGIIGVIVSFVIFYTGFVSAKDTISPLLGKAPDKEFIDKISQIVSSHKIVLGIHDLIVHDYGPGRIIISLHAEVDKNSNILEIHDEIDNIETELSEKLKCIAVIHMDPINTDDEETNNLKQELKEIVNSISDELSVHDLRVVYGSTHTNVIFDIAMPSGSNLTESNIKETVIKEMSTRHPNYICKITVERSFVN